MCDCFHLAFPNWHAASSGTGAGRRLRGPEPGAEDDSVCDTPSQFTGGERPRPQGSSPVEEYPEAEKYTDSDKECEAEHDPHHKSGTGKKTKKSGLGSMFERRSTPKMSKLKEVHSPEAGVIVKTAKDGCAEGLVYGGGGKDGIFIKEVVPESPASKSLKLKEGDQILSATVYFDNMSYEDAIQILEHAQAYKVKLCLKRQPDITETEPTLESDVIPEEDLYAPEMREQGKTKRRGDARISWPKFPSFGKGKKSRFTRSHSSSEADEQRKLELSPTTSDTESPIKSQDALKGKKKHKIKLPGLTKRGRISSSEDQDTDTPIPGQIPGKILPKHETSDMLSPECLESPSGETPEVYVTEDLKVEEDLRLEQNDQKLIEPQTVQHKAELITIDSTLKTADLTVALADKESPSGIKSPDGKKKKKERSELKIKILGKDKSHKKDTKAKASPKRLKTLGASIEIADQPENEKSVIPSFESQRDQQALDTQIISDDAFIRKSPHKGEEKKKKGKDSKQKETKTSPTFKLPKIGLGHIASEETIQKINVNVEGSTTKIEQLTIEGTEATGDPYERLSKSSQLPKREEIEIPGMEDMSMRTTTKGIKEPKVGFTGNYEEIQAETVQMSIDVDSVKEAVSKLPGFKLPKVDMSGVPIPEEIIVIDANAQRISVKTPTKVVDTKTKHETHFTKFDVTASPEISKTAVKLPKITPADLTSEELLIETKVDLKTPEMKFKITEKLSGKEIKTEVYKREDIIIPGKETQDTEKTPSPKRSDKKSKKAKISTASFGIAKPTIKIPDVGIHLPKQNISQRKGDTIKGEETIFIQEVKTSKTETRQGKGQIGGVTSDVKIPEIDGIEYIDSASGSPAKKDGGVSLAGFGVNLEAAKPNIDISIPGIRSEAKDVDAEEYTIKLPTFGAVTTDISVNVPDEDKDIHIDGADIKTFEREGKGSRFKMPNLNISMPKVKGPKIDLSQSKKDVDVTLPAAKAELLEVPEVDVTLGNVDVSIPEHKTGVELDGQGSKFKMPKLGITMPEVAGPEIDLNLSKKDVDVTLPEAKAEVKLPDVELKEPSVEVEIKAPEIKIATKDTHGSPSKFKMPSFKLPKFGGATPKKDVEVTLPEAKAELPEVPEVDATLGKVDVSISEHKTDGELDGQGSKFKMAKFGISLPKVKGPEIDLSSSKKDVDVAIPEVKAEVKLPDVESTEPGIKVEVKAPEISVHQQNVEGSPSKFKMPTFKLPKFGIGTPKVPDMDKDVKIDGADINIPEDGSAVNIAAPNIDIEGPSIDMKTTETEQDGKGSKFKMPYLGFSKPKVKGPKIDLSISKKDFTLPEAEADIKVPEVDLGKVDVSIPEAKTEVPEAKAEVNLPECEADMDGHGGKFKIPKFGIKMPKVKGPEFDLSLSKKDVDVELQTKADAKLPEVDLGKVDVSIPEAKAEVNLPECEADIDGHGGKFKIPKFGIKMPKVKGPEFDLSLSKKDVDVELPEGDLGKVDVSIPEAKMEINPELEMQSLQIQGELDGHGERLKMPKFGIKMPRVKGPEFDLSFSKKDVDVTLPETKADVKLPDAPKMEVSLGKAEVLIPETKAKVYKPQLETKPLQIEVEGQESKFKMPKFGMAMPNVKGPEFHLGFSKKDVDVTLPEAKADVNLPDVELKEPSAKVEIKAPEIEVVGKDTEGSSSKFKAPHFSVSLPKVKGPDIHLSLSKKDTDTTLPGTKAEVKLPGAPGIDASLGKAQVLIPEAKVEVKKPEVEIKPLQTDVDLEGQGGKFKMPKFGVTMPKVKGPKIDLSFSKNEVDVTLPEAKAEVELPGAPKIAMDIEQPECKAGIDGQGSKLKMPKFGMSMPKVKGPEIDFSLSKKDVDITLPEAKAEVSLPDVELKEPSAKVEIKAAEFEAPSSSAKGSPSKFKMPTFKFPKFGVATPSVSTEVPDKDKEIKIDGADVHISVPHTDVDVPEIKAEVQVPEVEVKEPSGIEVDAKMKKPRFSLPKFSFSKPSIKAPEVDVSLPDVNVAIPEGKVEVKGEEVDMKPTECEADVDGQGSKFKMPKFGITMPKVAGPEIDLSLSKKDVDVTLPEAKAEVKLPDVELKEPSAEVEIKAPEIKVATKDKEESPSKFKMPSFKLPKFGVGMPSATVEVPDMDKDVKIDGADITFPEEVLTVDIAEPSIDSKGPLIHMKTTDTEYEGKGSKFKMPKFGITIPKVTGPEIDLSLSKKDVDVTLPAAKAEVKLPDVELKEPSAEVEIKAPEIKVATKDTEGSPLKYKMPTVKLPKFGVGTPSATIEVPDTVKDIKIDGADIKIPEEVLTVEIAAPSIDTEGPSIHMKTTGTEHEGKGSKFKMPGLGFSAPQIKGPEIDLSKKDVDVTLPEAKAEVKLPDVELKEPAKVEVRAPEIKVVTKDKERSPSKFKMPSFKLPKFGIGTPSATIELPDTDKDVKIDGADIKIPEEVLTVEIAAPSIDTEGPSIKMKTTGSEHEGKGSKFKMPSLGFSAPQVKGPEIDLSLSKKDVDVTLPEAKAEVKLPDIELKEPSAKVEIKAPEIKVATKDKEGSPSKFKMPTFKLPKFGIGSPSATVEVPDTDKDIKIDGADIKIPEEVLTVEIAVPSIDTEDPSIHMKTTGTEHEGKGSRFKMPSLGFSAPQVKGPEIDLSLSKKDVDVTLPEAKAEVKLPDVELKKPSTEVEIKTPEIKVTTKEESPSKFKMPTFKLPKFGIGSPSATVEMPDMDKDIKIDGADIKIPEEILTVEIAAPSIDTEGPSIKMKTTGTEHEVKGSKFKMPSLGFSAPQVKGPEIDLSLSKKDVDVTLPEAKAKVKLFPDVEIKESVGSITEGDAKLKKTRFSLPRFSFSKQSLPDVDVSLPEGHVEVKQPEVELKTPEGDIELDGQGSKFKLPKFGISMPKVKGPEIDLSLSKRDVDVTVPEAKAGVQLPDVKIKQPSTGAEHEGKGSRFKMPSLSFSVPQVTGPEIDLSLSKKDVDVTVPEAKAEVQLPDVKLKQPAAKVDIKGPTIEAQGGNVEGSPSKLKMPIFSFPKFGAATPKVGVEVPDVDKDIKIDGAKVDVTAPSIDTEGLSVDVKAKGSEIEGSGSRFKMPKFGISMPKVKAPEIDLSLSKKDVDVTLPEAKAEVQLPDVKLKQPAAKVDIKGPTIEAQGGNVEGSPSKLKMPTFSFPKFGAATPKVGVEVPDVDKDIKIDGAKVDVTAPSIDTEGLSVDVKAKGSEIEGSGSRFKMPKFGISMPKVKAPEIDLSLSKKDVDVTVPEAKAEVQLPDVKLKQPAAKVDIKGPTIEAQEGNVEGSPSKLKMPTFSFPKFGAATPKVGAEVPDVDKDIKIDGAKVDVTAPSTDTKGLSVDVKAKGSEIEGSGSRFKMPKFGISMPKVKAPEIDLSLSKKDVDVTVPEAKAEVQLPDVKLKQPAAKVDIKGPTIEAQEGNVEGSPSKLKMPTFSFPKFGAATPKVGVEVPDVDKDIKIDGAKVDVTAPSTDTKGLSVDVKAKGSEIEGSGSRFKIPNFGISMPKVKAPEIDLSLSKTDADVTLPEAKAEVKMPNVKVKEPEVGISVPDAPTVEAEASVKRPNWTFPKFSFSRTGVKAPEVDVSLPEGEVNIKQPEMEFKGPELEAEYDGQGSKFKLPKFGIALPKVKGPEVDLNASQKDVDITLPEVKAEVKSSASVEIKASDSETESKDIGSPLKFKMPTIKMQKFGGDVTAEAPDAEKVAETDGAKIKDDVAVNIKGPSFDIKTDVSKAATTDAEMPKTETDSMDLGSPSKFKLPSFKMPRVSFSRTKQEEDVPVKTESKEDQLEMEGESKSPRMTLTSFGEILKTIDVEFDTPNKEEENLETVKPSGKQLELKLKDTNIKQETVKSPERTSWFKFPRFGLSSPSEPAKIPEKDVKSPAGETGDEEPSPTTSVQSSDAFADISSAVTSEHVGLSISSPTKVTVKYSDPNAATGLREMHSNIITSTTRTELISVEPNLPEKIILSPGVSSSSEDTLRLESGKIHVITSNIQATPEAQHSRLLTAVQVQPAGGLPLQSEAKEASSWTVEDSQSGTRTVYERHLVRETSSERSESKETFVITKQITHMFDSSEPISGETASSIQRLRDSVHSEKMRFFDGAEK